MMRWEGSYCGPAPTPAELWASWNLDPFALAILLALALWAGRSRSGAVGMIVLAIVFLSPLCALSSALFSARVVHHVLLVAIAAPLFALSRPARGAVPVGLPFLAATAALWLWHLPAAYDAALGNKVIYWVMQASLFASAFAFWRAAFSQATGSGAIWVFFAYLAMGMLGAILTLAPNAVYATHALTTDPWGLTPLADQVLGGLIMWMPAGLAYAGWGAVMATRSWRSIGQGA